MPLKVSGGHLIQRRWDQKQGITETPTPFRTLDELYAHCMLSPHPGMVDRIVIQGHDQQGQPRELTFVFQSATEG